VDATASYTIFEASVQYQSELDPDTMLIGIICSKVVDPAVGTVMYVDDLELLYDDVTSLTIPEEKRKITIFPNPSDGSFFCIHPSAVLAEISDINGRKVAVIASGGDQNAFSIHSLNGLYLVRFFDRNGELIGYSRIVFK
jgi:hypothetical protein